MVEGAHIVYSCRGQAEGPWREGDLLYVCLTRESGAIVVVSPDGSQEDWGAHHLPTMFRDWQAGSVAILWRSAEWCATCGEKWDAAPTSSHPPQVRASA